MIKASFKPSLKVKAGVYEGQGNKEGLNDGGAVNLIEKDFGVKIRMIRKKFSASCGTDEVIFIYGKRREVVRGATLNTAMMLRGGFRIKVMVGMPLD